MSCLSMLLRTFRETFCEQGRGIVKARKQPSDVDASWNKAGMGRFHGVLCVFRRKLTYTIATDTYTAYTPIPQARNTKAMDAPNVAA